MRDINKLRSIEYGDSKEFSLTLSVSNSAPTLFKCLKITRCLPGKRLSCIGNWKGKTIFAKFFIDPKRSKTHWQKEKQGYQLLSAKHILAPHLLHSGIENEIYFILFEFLQNTTPLKDAWSQSKKSEQPQLLRQLIATLATHHENGIIQKDLHLNNFLLSNTGVYTVDGADIRQFDPTDKQTASNNIALFFAQFFPDNDQNINWALDQYLSLRGWTPNQQLTAQIKATTLQIRDKRKKDRLDKTRRSCSLFDYQQNWSQLAICSRKFQSNEMQAFLNSPESFISNANLLKNGNTCTVVIVTINHIDMVVKRYNIKNWRHFLSRSLRPSRAIISWTNAHLLRFYGISTPEPVAVIEKRWGPVRKTAYFVSELSKGETADVFFKSVKTSLTTKQNVAQSITKLLQAMHSLKISHGDLKTSNFMISNTEASIIDLDSMKQHTALSHFKKAKKKDIKRFFKNWRDAPSIEAFFIDKLK